MTWTLLSRRVVFRLALALFALIGLSAGRQVAASAEHLSLRTYGRADGLGSLSDTCLMQLPNGSILACSENGLYSYGGHRFTALGPAEGLQSGDFVYDLVRSTGGYLYVRFADALYVSVGPVTPVTTVDMVRFRRVPLESGFFNDGHKQVAVWMGGIALLANGRLLNSQEDGPDFRATPIPINVPDPPAFNQRGHLLSVRGDLWLTTDDNRVCRVTPGAQRCFGVAEGLPDTVWHDVTAGDGRTVLVRSDTAMASIDPVTGRVTVTTLPDQGGWADTMTFFLGFFRDPAGRLMTQGRDGLIVQTDEGWQTVSFGGLGTQSWIAAVMSDRNGQLWLGSFAHGVARVLGYGLWDSVDEEDGLSSPLAWATARDHDGHLWVTTDSSLDEFTDEGGVVRRLHTFPGGTYALAVGPDGQIWAAGGRTGIRVVDPRTGGVQTIASPAVTGLAPGAGGFWIGTEDGLYALDTTTGRPWAVHRVLPDHTPVTALTSDGEGGIWYTAGSTLFRLDPGDEPRMAVVHWPLATFRPNCLAFTGDELWVGGSGGLYRFRLRGGEIVGRMFFDGTQLVDSSVEALLIDRAGRVWAGTGSGISVYDGIRWVSADQTSGLVWDDVAQNGISEDPDGTIWVATGNGLSHLLHPDRLFQAAAPNVTVEDVRLDGRALPAARIPFTSGPLTLDLGTSHYEAEDTVRFRYRMSGVDAAWVGAATGQIRYASVPPGVHTLTVVADNPLTHLSSPPRTLVIRMGWPWWRQGWAEALLSLVVLGAAFAFWQWRMRALLRNKRALERLVGERTRELELRTREIEASRRRVEDQALMLQRQADALRSQAIRDGLTGLLNRMEVERRLAETLEAPDTWREWAVALIDVDHFKRINDRFGHLAGDGVLRDTARRLAGGLTARDYAGRYGGEEFIVVLDDGDARAAERLLALQESIRGRFYKIGDTPERVTVSIGLAWPRPDDRWESLVDRADKALYAAKRAGRDRIVEEDPMERPAGLPGRAA